MINRIDLLSTLPDVFAGMEAEEPVSRSQIWLRDVSLERPGRYMIEAESGTGKSSLCSFIYGMRADYRGTILFDGVDVRSFTPEQWCQLRTGSIAYLPQEMRLFPELTVMENIDIKNRLTGFRSATWIAGALERLGIAQKADAPAGRLSVGQQQRVAIIRALCQPFSFLLIDEPVSHLDERNNAIVAALVSEAADEAGAAVIATSVGNKISLTFNRTLLL